jgi:hypothetical protein
MSDAENDAERLISEGPEPDINRPSQQLDVRFGSLADIRERIRDVRFIPRSSINVC